MIIFQSLWIQASGYVCQHLTSMSRPVLAACSPRIRLSISTKVQATPQEMPLEFHKGNIIIILLHRKPTAHLRRSVFENTITVVHIQTSSFCVLYLCISIKLQRTNNILWLRSGDLELLCGETVQHAIIQLATIQNIISKHILTQPYCVLPQYVIPKKTRTCFL